MYIPGGLSQITRSRHSFSHFSICILSLVSSSNKEYLNLNNVISEAAKLILKVMKNPAKSPELTRVYEIMFGFTEVFIEAIPTVLIQIVIMFRGGASILSKERCQLKKL